MFGPPHYGPPPPPGVFGPHFGPPPPMYGRPVGYGYGPRYHDDVICCCSIY